ncbi:hypothetical protein BD324DRAFT_608172 [Kockovaella imperatae]|uniref:Uncharacterized protein n=1 Tax=Kockovaella imperatae TaxID=4999 RepID=A0A1Y1UKG6_9TREE|nr:hypothetical protein BD324DRAFT_608172 [Kockovaella imperatae]ORX37615.1 hypothetical protein BD324DRAFT_608172 [Kockovaella imperatae]
MALPVILQESPTEAQPPSSYPPSLASFRQPSYSPFASVPSTEPVTSTSILTSAYNFGENSVLRLASWLRQPTPHRLVRRPSEDSEKGVGPGESEEIEIIDSVGSMRTSTESFGRDGQYWMDDGSTRGYFSLPRTSSPGYNDQYSPSASSLRTTLPTPALSTSSLSSSIGRKPTALGSPERHGWWSLVYKIWAGMIPQTAGGKTAEVIRDLGWTVALLAGVFIATASVALWLIRCMPITQLKHIPKSTTDLQLLSAEIRSYMASGDAGWYHTVGVLLFVGCWKHAWSVPGAVILNILVGSLLDPMPALFLLTIITATGSLFSYLLSRPLAPLIAVLFPKPLSLVRAALAPDSLPIPPSSGRATFAVHERITPIQISHDPTAEPLGSSNTSVWRRLLIMRAMGFVPWSGMNVACGVVGVDWKVFWLTTAAGSASWSYVTASVGNIISRLAIPQTSELVTGFDGDNVVSSAGGESLTSLLRDPVLITKMIFLSGLTLVPVILKRRSSSPSVAADGVHAESDRTSMDQTLLLSSGVGPKGPATGITSLDRLAPPPSLNPHRNHLHPAIPRLDMEPLTPNSSVPSSPLTDSLKKFTPTPAVFDLLSFGRTAARQGLRGAQGIGRKVASGIKGVSRDRH